MTSNGIFDQNAKICSCFGHKEISVTEEMRKNLRQSIASALDDGIKIFLFGGLSAFDDLVYDVVSALKNERVDESVKRVFCFPLDKQLRKPPRWYVKKDYEEMICPPKSFDGWYDSIYFRNCSMIDMSDLVLFCTHDAGRSGSFQAYKYAVKKHKKIINFFES